MEKAASNLFLKDDMENAYEKYNFLWDPAHMLGTKEENGKLLYKLL